MWKKLVEIGRVVLEKLRAQNRGGGIKQNTPLETEDLNYSLGFIR